MNAIPSHSIRYYQRVEFRGPDGAPSGQYGRVVSTDKGNWEVGHLPTVKVQLEPADPYGPQPVWIEEHSPFDLLPLYYGRVGMGRNGTRYGEVGPFYAQVEADAAASSRKKYLDSLPRPASVVRGTYWTPSDLGDDWRAAVWAVRHDEEAFSLLTNVTVMGEWGPATAYLGPDGYAHSRDYVWFAWQDWADGLAEAA